MDEYLKENDLQSTNPSHGVNDADMGAIKGEESPRAVSPGEEPSNTRGLQNGEWDYVDPNSDQGNLGFQGPGPVEGA